MIISCSRRTDVPAYYSNWFIDKIKKERCEVPNPFNFKQVSEVDLSPGAVDCFVFWSRNPYPLMKKLSLLDERGYPYYFLYTLNDYPRKLEPFRPGTKTAIETFKRLSNRIGAGKVVWRYDPILICDSIDFDYHLKKFEYLSKELSGYSKKVIISVVTPYRKTTRRMSKLCSDSYENLWERDELYALLERIAEIASGRGLAMEICCGEKDLTGIGIKPGKCIDAGLIDRELGKNLSYRKDPNQRKNCNCAKSKDIGMNDTCLMNCAYCYATNGIKSAIENYKRCDIHSERLIGRI